MASLAVSLPYSNSILRMSAEYRGLTKGSGSGGGGGGEGSVVDRRFRARISLIVRILAIKKPKEIATLLIFNIVALYE